MRARSSSGAAVNTSSVVTRTTSQPSHRRSRSRAWSRCNATGDGVPRGIVDLDIEAIRRDGQVEADRRTIADHRPRTAWSMAGIPCASSAVGQHSSPSLPTAGSGGVATVEQLAERCRSRPALADHPVADVSQRPRSAQPSVERVLRPPRPATPGSTSDGDRRVCAPGWSHAGRLRTTTTSSCVERLVIRCTRTPGSRTWRVLGTVRSSMPRGVRRSFQCAAAV